jgi:hypothetical protein
VPRRSKTSTLILVSTGTPEENRGMGLRARIALDPGFTVAPIYGVSGTPSAVLLDTSGRATQPPAVGAPAVMALAVISETGVAR